MKTNYSTAISACVISVTILTTALSGIPAHALTNPSEHFGQDIATSAFVASTVNNAKDIYSMDRDFNKYAVVNLASADTSNAITSTAPVTSMQNNKVTINGKSIAFKVAPVMKDNTLYVPAIQLAEALGCKTTLQGKTVTFTHGSIKIVITQGSINYTVNVDKKSYFAVGNKTKSITAPFLKSGILMIPVHTIPEALGISVNGDADTLTGTIVTGKFFDFKILYCIIKECNRRRSFNIIKSFCYSIMYRITINKVFIN